jgi:HSP20 family molecular chaperone IbpA
MSSELQVNEKAPSETEGTRTGNVYRPLVDILEDKDELILVADLPGASSDSIDINFEDGVLTVQGQVEPRYKSDHQFLLVEYGLGDFYRTFRVSEQIDSSRIHATYADGVLTVHLPKVEAAKPRKIEVRAGA